MPAAAPTGHMTIKVKCPECGWKQRSTASDAPQRSHCPRCAHDTPLSWSDSILADRLVDVCPVCEGRDFFIHKDLNRNLGLTIVIIVALISVAFLYYEQDILAYGVLFAFALVDLVIYQMLTFVTVCYRCHTEFRGGYERKAPYFDLHVAEKLELEYSRRRGGRTGADQASEPAGSAAGSAASSSDSSGS